MNFKVIGLILLVAILLNVLLWLQTEPFININVGRMTIPAHNYDYNRHYSSTPSSDAGLPIWAIALIVVFGLVIVGLIISAVMMLFYGDPESSGKML
jgi:hypothetical protein